jgi:hypothetical protein
LWGNSGWTHQTLVHHGWKVPKSSSFYVLKTSERIVINHIWVSFTYGLHTIRCIQSEICLAKSNGLTGIQNFLSMSIAFARKLPSCRLTCENVYQSSNSRSYYQSIITNNHCMSSVLLENDGTEYDL